ncbi:hypothetical protein SprV_0100364300 [Sparganum proliferum]
MLLDVDRDKLPGINIVWRTNCQLHHTQRMRDPARLSTATTNYLLLADDCAFTTATKPKQQRSRSLFAAGCTYFGVTINTDKAVVMQPSRPNTDDSSMTTNDTQLKIVDNFACLGSTLSYDIKIDDKVAH